MDSCQSVLAMKNLLFDKGGVPQFVAVVKQAGYKLGASRNTRYVRQLYSSRHTTVSLCYHLLQSKTIFRFLSADSDVPYFKVGVNPVGKCTTTSATLVDLAEESFQPLVRLLKVSLLFVV